MDIDSKSYKKYAEARAKKSPLLSDCIKAFLFGGLICAGAQVLFNLYHNTLGATYDDASLWVSVTLVFLAALLTGLGVFDDIAKHAGAGTLVPITGFANSVVSPAIDTKAEGFIMGVGAKIFTVAGPVILYGTLAGTVYGIIYWLCQLFK
jgi:stage V sporulation protein AC